MPPMETHSIFAKSRTGQLEQEFVLSFLREEEKRGEEENSILNITERSMEKFCIVYTVQQFSECIFPRLFI